ncbi:N(4)-(beta-N-acetylglucosaminyl)-L-asparaginase [Roseivirga spongicola]|jgi:L-asparaginase/N4-(beta-N-acetylglucosaminyl)-L-asparaginase|uniref:isoaspartyl peptidase/L-asparaginase family protein n=1 Tax=Roseivirga spongicola TaxID=333140 RepID=UPI0025843F5D|nr:N(4)-(beta-N-acetylglucosaminyl)-L-asparaginase [Roseivirga spongicola]WPZ11749.1 N(4)-(beta-N-acetylglucosaminyl)-L-asparaginase [Roseivirga spongicola]
MADRRKFLKSTIFSGLAVSTASLSSLSCSTPKEPKKPIVISTWNHGKEANAAAWEVLSKNGKAVDAVEKGVMVTENDPNNATVGIGGFPDRDGNVTLDACIMDENDNAGSVAFLQNFKNPISVARKVMDDTPHVMLVGEGAKKFALSKGFKEENLLTESSEKAWKNWLKNQDYEPEINIENHDTIGMVALDENGNLSGACTTSGAAWKMHGRVGDSPIIGAGLFVDNEIGAATATGLGEFVIKICGSHMIVELMRQGFSPQEACEQAVNRIVKKYPDNYKNLQVGFLALNKQGEYGAYSIHKGFNFAVRSNDQDELIDAGNYSG